MYPSKQLQNYIKGKETLQLNAYPDPPGSGLDSIAWGHQIQPNEQNLRSGVTEQQAEQIFQSDISKFSEGVNRLLRVSLNQDQYDAVFDLAYNIGLSGLANSHLLTQINNGYKNNEAIIAAEFRKWNTAGGQVNSGLTKRREDDINIYFGRYFLLGMSRKKLITISITLIVVIIVLYIGYKQL